MNSFLKSGITLGKMYAESGFKKSKHLCNFAGNLQ